MSRPASKTLSGLVEEMAARCPDRPFVTFQNRTLTFAQIRREAIDAAKAMHALGVRRGDKVGILMGNCVEWIVSNFAAQYLGAVMVGVNTWYTQRELAYVLEHADVKLLVSAESFLRSDYVAMLNALQPYAENGMALAHVVMRGDRTANGSLPYAEFLTRGQSVSDQTILDLSREVSPEDVAYLLYTSGSTAHPKGVMLIQRHLVENTYDIGERMRFGPDEAVFTPLSLFWGMGCMNMLLGPLSHGMHIVMQEQFDAAEALQLIQQHRCSMMAGTANIVHAVFAHPDRDRYDLSSIRGGTCLGSPDVSLNLLKTVMPLGIRCYGLTETHGFATMHDADDPVEKRSSNEGRALPGFEVLIVDPETQEVLGPGEIGEVRLRGRIMRGYYKNPEATSATFDAQGRFMTGDIGSVDEEGYLTFRGRYKEMLKTGGINVAPAEVEEVLLTHPAIEDAYVCGVPDPVREQLVAAVVVLKPQAVLDEEQLVSFCRDRMAAYKVPRRVRFVAMDDLPQTTTRKVHRLQLPKLFETTNEASA